MSERAIQASGPSIEQMPCGEIAALAVLARREHVVETWGKWVAIGIKHLALMIHKSDGQAQYRVFLALMLL